MLANNEVLFDKQGGYYIRLGTYGCLIVPSMTAVVLDAILLPYTALI
jgi:hypothetical protein